MEGTNFLLLIGTNTFVRVFNSNNTNLNMTRYLKNMEKEIIINNQPDEITRIAQFIDELGMSLQLPPSITMSVNLAIEEAISNIIHHGYPTNKEGEITLLTSVAPGILTARIIDNGISFDPTERNTDADNIISLDQQLTQGLGLFLIRRTMDKVEYHSTESQNELTLIKKIDMDFKPEASLKTNICKIEEVTILTIEGRLDTANSNDFNVVISPLLSMPTPNIIINVEGLLYISSSGLRSLITLQKCVRQHQGVLVIEAMRPEILKIFDMTGCSSLLPFAKTPCLMKKSGIISCILLLTAFFSAGTTNAQSIVLTPKWTAQAQFAGYYVAEKMGFYKEEGLDVRIQHPSLSESSFSFLKKGKAQAVVMNLSYALTEFFAGARVVNILQTSQENSLMLVSHSPLKGLTALQHQKIAVWNHLSQELLGQVANKYQLQVEWIRFNGGVNIFLSKAADICLVGSYNEFLQLAECGMKTDSTHVMHFADYGYNLPEDGLYVTEEFYEKYPEAARKLAKASMRGWEWANEHREETLDIIMEEVHLHNIGTNRYHQRKMLDEVLRLQTNRESGKRTFRLSHEGFDRATSILLPAQKKTAHIRYENFVK